MAHLSRLVEDQLDLSVFCAPWFPRKTVKLAVKVSEECIMIGECTLEQACPPDQMLGMHGGYEV